MHERLRDVDFVLNLIDFALHAFRGVHLAVQLTDLDDVAADNGCWGVTVKKPRSLV